MKTFLPTFLVVIAAPFALAACGAATSQSPEKEGDTKQGSTSTACTSNADCASGLVCIAPPCSPEATSCPSQCEPGFSPPPNPINPGGPCQNSAGPGPCGDDDGGAAEDGGSGCTALAFSTPVAAGTCVQAVDAPSLLGSFCNAELTGATFLQATDPHPCTTVGGLPGITADAVECAAPCDVTEDGGSAEDGGVAEDAGSACPALAFSAPVAAGTCVQEADAPSLLGVFCNAEVAGATYILATDPRPCTTANGLVGITADTVECAAPCN